MKISSIDVYQIESGNGSRKDSKWKPVVIRINTDEGICGFGEVGLAYGAGSSAGVGMVKDFSRFVIGADPMRIEAIWEKLFRKTFWGMGGGTVVFGGMSAIDTACWDIKGKALGVPVYELLGGKTRDRVRTYASQIQNDWGRVNRNLVKPEEYAEAALKAVAEGYDCIKVDPVGFNADGEWATANLGGLLKNDQLRLFSSRVKAIRSAVGPDVDIIIELHSFLGTSSAIQFGNAIEECSCLFCEEPIHPLNVDDMAKVAQGIRTPLAGGERIQSRWGYRPYFEKGVLAVAQPDIGLAGGFTETKKICDYASIYDVNIQCHVCGSPLATAAALQMEAAIPNFLIHEHHANALHESNLDMCTHRYEPHDGFFEIPDLPGIGQELTESVMKKSLALRIE